MTEDQAKTKWCPFVRTGLVSGMAVNRHIADAPGAFDGVYDETRCRASDCMMWRWKLVYNEADPTSDLVDSAVEGYCGMSYA